MFQVHLFSEIEETLEVIWSWNPRTEWIPKDHLIQPSLYCMDSL